MNCFFKNSQFIDHSILPHFAGTHLFFLYDFDGARYLQPYMRCLHDLTVTPVSNYVPTLVVVFQVVYTPESGYFIHCKLERIINIIKCIIILWILDIKELSIELLL